MNALSQLQQFMSIIGETLRAEESRIHEAYARRRSGSLYSRFNWAYLFMAQEREQHCLELLAKYGLAQLKDKKILEVVAAMVSCSEI